MPFSSSASVLDSRDDVAALVKRYELKDIQYFEVASAHQLNNLLEEWPLLKEALHVSGKDEQFADISIVRR